MPKPQENATAAQLARRARNTEWSRARDAKRLAEKNAKASSCQRRQGGSTCGGRLDHQVVNGRVETTCLACARRVRGICRDCPRPVEGKLGLATRCAPCKKISMREKGTMYYRRHAEEKRATDRARRKQWSDEKREARNMANKIWRRAHPEKLAEYRRREAETRRDVINEYHREYREANRALLAEKARKNYYRYNPVPRIEPCRECGGAIQWAPPGRPKKICDACVPASVRARRRPAVPDYVRPVADAPPRTCVTRGCDIVVTHRTKKCNKCKAKHAAMARTLLNARAA